MIRKSLESPWPMNMHPRSTSNRSFLYTSLSGVNVCLDKCGSKSPTTRALVNDAEGGKREHTFDARELGEIIDDDFTRMDVVVNEWDAFFRTIPSQDRHTCKTVASRSNDTVRAVGSVLCFFLWNRNTRLTGQTSRVECEPTCCIDTNSASIATSVPGLGNSSKRKHSCLIRLLSRFLRHAST